jgi:hypothetical protein
MCIAAAHLDLPRGKAPTIAEFKQAARETHLPMTFMAVYAAFEGRWETATRVYEGKKVPRTPAQRAVQRAILGRNRTDKEPPLTCIRMFLTQDPPPASTGLEDYRAWAQQKNENLRAGEKRVVEDANHIHSVLRVGWERCLEVARDETTLKRAQALTLSEYMTETGPLISHHLASWYLGLSPYSRHAGRPGYPAPVIRVHETNWLWLRAHIEEFKAGKRDFTHEPGALEGTYLDSPALVKLINLNPKDLHAFLRRGYSTNRWDRLPAPTGRAGRYLYWDRAYVTNWQRLQTQPRTPPVSLRGAETAGKRGKSAAKVRALPKSPAIEPRTT